MGNQGRIQIVLEHHPTLRVSTSCNNDRNYTDRIVPVQQEFLTVSKLQYLVLGGMLVSLGMLLCSLTQIIGPDGLELASDVRFDSTKRRVLGVAR